MVPLTCRSPRINTVPLLSLRAAGSRVIEEGPVIVSLVTTIAEPEAPVANDVAVTPPVTLRVEPSNVRLPLSSSSPPEPARTIRPSVRSEIAAELAVRPPAMSAPPSTSRAPVTVAPADTRMSVVPSWLVVVIPVAWRFTKLAPAPPPRT